MIYIDDSEPEGVLEPAFPYRDVTIKRGVDAHTLYDILGEVGRGKFGTVYRCQEKGTGLKLAAKFVPIPKRDDKRSVEREVEIMNSLQHHLIIQLYAAYEYQKMMCVVLELIEGGELFDRVVDDEFVLTERVCVVFIRQVCEAMEFIHRNNILHLDLKPENILCLTQEGNRIKIIDFGLARKFDPDKKLQILFGTPEFVAPEVVNFDCISYATDMWSVGVICYVLISGLSPFMGETDIETMANVTIAKYDFEDESFSNVSSECLDFIAKLLVKDLNTRMTAAQCLEHKWLQRRPAPPPVLTPKPTNVPPAHLKAATPSPIPPQFEVNDEPAQPIDMEPQPDIKAAATATAIAAAAAVAEDELAAATKTGKELDTTKDNLKNFIERWEEHPNSPYVFDVESNVITPISETTYKTRHGPDSISSSRVCSPSPCESFDTLTDDEDVFCGNDDSPNMLATPINESREKLFPTTPIPPASGGATPTPQFMQHEPFGSVTNLQSRSMKSYLHTFDRRNSDTNYLIGRRASGERVNLADEIKKLSDHLLMLAQINNKLGSDSHKRQAGDANNNVVPAKSSTTTKTTAKSKTSSSTKTKSSTKTQTKLAKTLNASTHAESNSSTSTYSESKFSDGAIKSTSSSTTSNATTSKTSSSFVEGKSRYNNISLRLQQSIEETPTLTNGWKATTNHTQLTNSATSSQRETAHTRRAKFRVNQMSRDVPIGLPDTHQTVNLEEAANTTKDCLLHLLEKYNETKGRNPMGRHQSISVDWHVSDNLEYRSMSSINAFFQRHSQHANGQYVKQLQAQLENKTTGK